MLDIPSSFISIPSSFISINFFHWHCRAGYFNMFQQSFLPPLQPFGENSHFVGATNNFQPPSPAPAAPYANERASIDLDEDDGVEASKSVKKRYWSHDEEVRLASAWLNTSKDPIHGNDKNRDSF